MCKPIWSKTCCRAAKPSLGMRLPIRASNGRAQAKRWRAARRSGGAECEMVQTVQEGEPRSRRGGSTQTVPPVPRYGGHLDYARTARACRILYAGSSGIACAAVGALFAVQCLHCTIAARHSGVRFVTTCSRSMPPGELLPVCKAAKPSPKPCSQV